MLIFFQYSCVGLLEGGLYALFGAAVVLVYKATQVASLAHCQFLAFGAFLFCIFHSTLGLPFIVAFFLTLAGICLLGIVVERLALRPLIGQPLFSAFLATFALFIVLDGVFNIIIRNEVRNFPDLLPLWHINLFRVQAPLSQLVGFIVALVLFGLLGLFFRFTKIGLNMLATAENHQLAMSCGINVKKIFSIIWGISAIVAASGGMAAANIMDINYNLPYLGIKGLIVAIFGGLNSILGALLGGLILGILENVAAGYIDPLVGGGVKEVAPYAIMLGILIIRPYGLFGQIQIERI